jgi:hypothetical protein
MLSHWGKQGYSQSDANIFPVIILKENQSFQKHLFKAPKSNEVANSYKSTSQSAPPKYITGIRTFMSGIKSFVAEKSARRALKEV